MVKPLVEWTTVNFTSFSICFWAYSKFQNDAMRKFTWNYEHFKQSMIHHSVIKADQFWEIKKILCFLVKFFVILSVYLIIFMIPWNIKLVSFFAKSLRESIKWRYSRQLRASLILKLSLPEFQVVFTVSPCSFWPATY